MYHVPPGNRVQVLHSHITALAVAGYWFEFVGLQDLAHFFSRFLEL